MHLRFTCMFLTALVGAPAPAAACVSDGGDTSFRAEVSKYLTRYEAAYQTLYSAWQSALWDARTHAAAQDSGARDRLVAAEQAFSAYAGSIENTELSRAYLYRRKELVPAEQRELDHIAWLAAGESQIVTDLVSKRIAAETLASETLHGFAYQLDGAAGNSGGAARDVTLEEIDDILRDETDLGRRRAAWDAAHAPGSLLRAPLVALRWLRNEIVRALGQRDYFAWRVAEYGLSSNDMIQRVDQILHDLRPLQTELHTWARYELARRYGQPVPDLIPAHWLPSRSAEDWSALADAPQREIESALNGASALEIAQRAEGSWVSLGFEPLPQSFWERSSLFSLPANAGSSKAFSVSAWSIDLQRDVRALARIGADARGYGEAHDVLGRAECRLFVAQPDVPNTLRRPACRAFEESVGGLMQLASEQPRFLSSSGLVTDAEPAPMQILLEEALRYVELVSWSGGTMMRFERGIYSDNLAPEHWNERFWQLCAQCQGIAPPSPRDERWCDAAADPDLLDHPGDAYDHALGCVLLFQMHDHIARRILYQDAHDTDYRGRKEVGEFLKSILRFGATVDWRAKLREKTGYDLSARAMVDYFEPLRRWLAEQNKGRTATLPPL